MNPPKAGQISQEKRKQGNTSKRPKSVTSYNGPHREWIRTGFRFIFWGIFLLIPIIGLFTEAYLKGLPLSNLAFLLTDRYVWIFLGFIVAGILMLFFYFDFKNFRFRCVKSRRVVWNFKNYVFIFTFIPVFGMFISLWLIFPGLTNMIGSIYPYFFFWTTLLRIDTSSLDIQMTPLLVFFACYLASMSLGTYLGYGRLLSFGLRLSAHHHPHYWYPSSYDDDDYYSSLYDDDDRYDDDDSPSSYNDDYYGSSSYSDDDDSSSSYDDDNYYGSSSYSDDDY